MSTQHTVVSGDTLWALSRQYKTTVDIIMDDNPIITNANVVQAGWVLTVRTPEEVAEENMAAARSDESESGSVAAATIESDLPPITTDNAKKIMWDNTEVVEGQTGRVRILRTIPLVERLEDGTFRELSSLEPPTTWRTFERITGEWWTYLDGPDVHVTALYNLGGNQWVYDIPGYVELQNFPPDIDTKVKKPEVTIASAKPRLSTEIETYKPKVPYFNPRGHERPVLSIKKNNKIITMELRVLGAGGNYSNQIQTNQTNGGWLINIAGSNLTAKTISGVFLDTESNHEFDDFMANYKNYLVAYRDGDFYSSAICTFYYKGREYKGLIAAFNYSDTESEPLLRRFTMQLLVLKEKGPESGSIQSPKPGYAEWDIYKEQGEEFFSDIRYLIINPITGLYGSDAVKGGN